jgi:hypothetical protein
VHGFLEAPARSLSPAQLLAGHLCQKMKHFVVGAPARPTCGLANPSGLLFHLHQVCAASGWQGALMAPKGNSRHSQASGMEKLSQSQASWVGPLDKMFRSQISGQYSDQNSTSSPSSHLARPPPAIAVPKE